MTHAIPGSEPKTIAIVGGGASGALTAYHLRKLNQHLQIVIIEPRPKVGLGLAYSTPSMRHLLNVPAGKISALPDQANHFLDWLRLNFDAQADEETFAPRALFGQYIQSLLEDSANIQTLHAAVVGCQISRDQIALTLDNDQQIQADRVVLAMGNFAPAPLPRISEACKLNGSYRHDAWDPQTFVGLDPMAPVTLIGTGLTAVDVLLRLRELGHQGIITALSRHAAFPHRHKPHPTLPWPVISSDTPATCLAYARALKSAIQSGVDWRSAIDSLRATTNDLWLKLPPDEQKRFRRHLQRRWDVVRHRMAPVIADVIDHEREAKSLKVLHGQLTSVEPGPDDDALITLSGTHGRDQFATRRVINCTGPNMNYRKAGSPLLDSLFASGAISPGPLGGGLRCDTDGAVLNAAGQRSTVLFSLGPARLGTLLESIAIPELRQQAVVLAKTLVGSGLD